ncbi:Uncharacterized protein Adt_40044 [Abeliophyllum distichum]|uniref:Uncharacterized protein n=1 Tax=Abeliophyllum distichum TaxID=126358 RepID=A0ABD1Q8I1_9LAMI
MFQQYMQKTDKVLERLDTNCQNQQASIRKIETQIDLLAMQLLDRKLGTLLSNTVTNLKEKVDAIITRSGVQLPEIHMKMQEKKDKQLAIEEEEAGKQDAKSKEEEYVKKREVDPK